jgi:hypothetical protein
MANRLVLPSSISGIDGCNLRLLRPSDGDVVAPRRIPPIDASRLVLERHHQNRVETL